VEGWGGGASWVLQSLLVHVVQANYLRKRREEKLSYENDRAAGKKTAFCGRESRKKTGWGGELFRLG
jgi:hypothetical protein